MLCPTCTADARPIITVNGLHLMASCRVCKRYIKFIAKTPDSEFVMPFGKYQGMKLDDIKDKGYLQIIHDHFKISGRFKRLLAERLKKDI